MGLTVGLWLAEYSRTNHKFGEAKMEDRNEDEDLLPESHSTVVALCHWHREVLYISQVIKY